MRQWIEINRGPRRAERVLLLVVVVDQPMTNKEKLVRMETAVICTPLWRGFYLPKNLTTPRQQRRQSCAVSTFLEMPEENYGKLLSLKAPAQTLRYGKLRKGSRRGRRGIRGVVTAEEDDN
ncbi:unnamed protein product [Nippostrongylus brasiliensis]|uniref:Uncharacterized protein n=1 Tax=Nippostrongylus brasiliensis TaxID=27835 RepID=A0A0N4YBT9_NIPBR|nr:unnamed protein product [Nippostrongylus brasiliensis]